MPSKTPRIFTFFLFIAGILLGNSVFAAAPKNLTECQTAYFQAVQVPESQRSSSVVQNTMKAWCATQCINEKISVYAAQQNQPVTSALTAQLTPAYQSTCNAQFGVSTSSTVAGTQTGTGAVPSTSTAAIPGCEWKADPSAQPTDVQQYNCQMAIQRKAAEDRARAAQAAQSTGSGDNGQRAAQNTMLGAAIAPPLINAVANGMGGGSGSQASSGAAGSTGAAGSPGTYATSQFNTPYGGNVGAAPPAPIADTPAQAQQQIAAAQPEMRSYEERLPAELRDQARDADGNITRDANGENPTPPTRITQAANQGTSTTNEKANGVMQRLRPFLCITIQPATAAPGQPPLPAGPAGGINFAGTLAAFEKFLGEGQKGTPQTACGGSGAPSAAPGNTPPASSPQSEQTANASGSGNASQGRQPACAEPPANGSAVQRLNAQRDCQCARATESAERLCVESEGMKGMRQVMDAAGPLLMGLNAAAKTCGGMNDVSKFVGAGLTIANAVCVREKMKCESTCDKIIGEFAQGYTTFNGALPGAYNGERATWLAHCNRWKQLAAEGNTAAPPNVAKCETVISQLEGNFNTARTVANQINQGEQSATSPGTVPQLSALCKAKQRNIIGLATNIGAIALAAANAKKCEKELASKGSGDNGGLANVNSAEYCSAEATRDSQFCKCQSSPSTTGCAAVLAAGPSGDAPTDQRGVNLQSGRGPAAFAGGAGSGNSTLSGGYRGYNGGSDGSATTQSNLGSVTSSMGGGSGSSAGTLSGAGAGGGSGSSADLKEAKKDDDKKWSFGSFASSIGSSLGFGGGGGYRGDGGGGNSLAAGNQAAIERKLASDRYAAEVSPSTGADNFSKIKRSYVQKADTFMGP